MLKLGQEVGRSDPPEARAAEVAVDGDAGQTAGNNRVGDGPWNRRRRWRGETERLLARVRHRLRPRDAEFVDHRRRHDMRPAADDGVGLDRLVAERRGAGSVDDAAEGAGDLTHAVRIDIPAEDTVVRLRLPVEPRQQTLGVVDELRGAEKV